MTRNLLNYLSLYLRALSSVRRAVGLSDAGIMFNRFGRQHGWRLIWRLVRGGFAYLINPVSSFRYFEFPFALSSLPSTPGRCLDVSSPSLFSFYVSQKCHPASIWMINPDRKDIQLSATVVEKLKISNIRTECCGVDVLEASREAFDSIWAISVVEHIFGKYDDRQAVRLMYGALAAGGHLILTVPVDRQFWEEYRDQEYYGISKEQSDSGRYFFQSYYDKAAIWKRLVDTIGVTPSSVRWFGEKRAGHYLEYEKRWLREGFNCTFDDPMEMSENYREFPSWEMMPGKGVCGLLFKKPREG
jgi:hypothetical protein